MESRNITNERACYSSEKYLEKALKAAVEKKSGLCIKLLSQHMVGLPDRMCLFPKGRIIFVEVKSKGKKPRKIQKVVHDRLRSLGFLVLVLDSREGLAALETIFEDGQE